MQLQVEQLEKEKKVRVQLEEERRVLAAFVSKFDSLTGLGAGAPPTKPAPPGPVANFAKRNAGLGTIEESPLRGVSTGTGEPSLLEENLTFDGLDDESFEVLDRPAMAPAKKIMGVFGKRKENVPA